MVAGPARLLRSRHDRNPYHSACGNAHRPAPSPLPPTPCARWPLTEASIEDERRWRDEPASGSRVALVGTAALRALAHLPPCGVSSAAAKRRRVVTTQLRWCQ